MGSEVDFNKLFPHATHMSSSTSYKKLVDETSIITNVNNYIFRTSLKLETDACFQRQCSIVDIYIYIYEIRMLEAHNFLSC